MSLVLEFGLAGKVPFMVTHRTASASTAIVGRPHECPVELTALMLCRAAVPHIIRDLAEGSKTFTELRTRVVEDGGSSSRTLAARLKILQQEGYVSRTELGGYLRRVEYDLTEKGRSLVPVVEAMKEFGESWLMDADCEDLP